VADVEHSDLTSLAGGWSGETFLARAGDERTVVRIYTPGRRSDAAPEIDAAVMTLVRGLVPVPDVLEVRRGSAAADRPGLLVTSYVRGERGDLVMRTLDDKRLSQLGARLGGLLADLAGMPTLRAGIFLDPTLRVGDFGVADDLPGFVAGHAAALGWSARWRHVCSSWRGAPRTSWTASRAPASFTPTSTPRTSCSTRPPSRSPGWSTGSSRTRAVLLKTSATCSGSTARPRTPTPS
jgi:hypothetical protein